MAWMKDIEITAKIRASVPVTDTALKDGLRGLDMFLAASLMSRLTSIKMGLVVHQSTVEWKEVQDARIPEPGTEG